MVGHHVTIGISLLLVTLVSFGLKFFLTPKYGNFRLRGWAGALLVLLAECSLYFAVPWVKTFFTPIVWTGYLLLVDAMVSRLTGQSRLSRSPREFFWLVFWSCPLWLIFEVYNLRLENWTYIGLPESAIAQGIGGFWAFATIWPAIYETADLVEALGFVQARAKHGIAFGRSSRAVIFAMGLLLVTFPVLAPLRIGQYVFGAVWVGFILLLDPFNYQWKGRSLLRELEEGDTSNLYCFLVAGLVCGILWEFWNYWAGAKWLYIFPILQQTKIFEMPLPGFLGFPPFALECFVMYEFVRTAGKRLAGFRHGSGSQPEACIFMPRES
jgi:hypothetical protein